MAACSCYQIGVGCFPRLMQCKSVCSLAAIRLEWGTSCGFPSSPNPWQPLLKYLSSSLFCSRLTPGWGKHLVCVSVRQVQRSKLQKLSSFAILRILLRLVMWGEGFMNSRRCKRLLRLICIMLQWPHLSPKRCR